MIDTNVSKSTVIIFPWLDNIPWGLSIKQFQITTYDPLEQGQETVDSNTPYISVERGYNNDFLCSNEYCDINC